MHRLLLHALLHLRVCVILLLVLLLALVPIIALSCVRQTFPTQRCKYVSLALFRCVVPQRHGRSTTLRMAAHKLHFISSYAI